MILMKLWGQTSGMLICLLFFSLFSSEKHRGPVPGRYAQMDGAMACMQKLLTFYLDFENLIIAVYRRMIGLR